MAFARKTLALLAWIAIYIPTTLFVVVVMVKGYLQRDKTGNGGHYHAH